MGLPVEHDVLVHLIAEQQDVRALEQVGNGQHVGLPQDGPGRIVRGVDHQQPRAWGDGLANGLRIEAHVTRQPHVHRHSPEELHRRSVAVVGRVHDDHLITGMHHRGDGREDGLGATGRDGDLGGRIVLHLVKPFHLVGQRLQQGGQPRHGCVLVMTGTHGGMHTVRQLGVDRKVGEALTEVDGADLVGQAAHHREDGGADVGKLGSQVLRHRSAAITPSSRSPPGTRGSCGRCAPG